MLFRDFFYRVVLSKERVKNASPSPFYSGSLIKDWERYQKRTANKCARCGCKLTENNKVGGHVLKVHGIPIDYYVVPLCEKCNHSSVTQPYYVFKSEIVRLIDIKRN